MKFPFHPWRRLLLCALPFAALLTACDDGKKEPPPKPAEVTTYNSVPWDALPATSDADLLAGVVREAGAPVVCETPGGAPEHLDDFAWLRERL